MDRQGRRLTLLVIPPPATHAPCHMHQATWPPLPRPPPHSLSPPPSPPEFSKPMSDPMCEAGEGILAPGALPEEALEQYLDLGPFADPSYYVVQVGGGGGHAGLGARAVPAEAKADSLRCRARAQQPPVDGCRALRASLVARGRCTLALMMHRALVRRDAKPAPLVAAPSGMRPAPAAAEGGHVGRSWSWLAGVRITFETDAG